MTNHKLSLEQAMKTNRNILPWLAGAALACAVLAAPAARAQTVSTVTRTTSGFIGTVTQVSPTGTVSAIGLNPTAGIALPPGVTVSGPVTVTANYIPDPAGGPATMAYSIDATGLSATDATTGTVYSAASGQADVTRPFALTETLVVTMSIYAKTATGYLNAHAFALHLNVTNDATTKAMTAINTAVTAP